MKKQNTLEWLVQRLDAWPKTVRTAPVINGWSWINSAGEPKLVSGSSMITKNEWLYPDSAKAPSYREMWEYEKERADKLQTDLNRVDELHYDECEKLNTEIAKLKQQLKMKEVN